MFLSVFAFSVKEMDFVKEGVCTHKASDRDNSSDNDTDSWDLAWT